MKQLTIRGIDSRLDHHLKQEAERRGQSVNRYVLSILRTAAGENPGSQSSVRYDDLDHLAGTWTEEEFVEFEQLLAAQRSIDEDLWR
jgi:plasmid stability protein